MTRTRTTRRLHAGRLPTALFVIVLALTIGGWFLAQRWVDQRENAVLDESAASAVAVVSSFARQVEAILYAGSVIAGALSEREVFERALGDRIEGTAITSISVLEPEPGRYATRASAGPSSPLLVESFSADAERRLAEIARSDGDVRVVEVTDLAAGRVIGFATSAGDGRRLVYAETVVPRLQGMNVFLRLPEGVHFATYLLPPGPETLIQATTDDVPFTGRTVSQRLQLGDEPAVVIVGAEGALVGGLTGATPWIVLAGGILLAAVLALVLELTQRRREAETQRLALVAQNERLRELDRLKDELVATVSHELRTPLTSILGYLELIREDPGSLSGEHRAFLEIVERNARRLLGLVSDLLFVARIDAGRLELDLGDVDLRALVEESVEANRPAAERVGVELSLSSDDVPYLAGDRPRLAQLVDNLVSNAIKFSPSGGRVDVTVERREASAVIEVADTGIGIPAVEQDRLFERFFRSTNAAGRAIQGTGLGLTIAKAIVDAHGGTISVESAEGEGTTFRVELPLDRRRAGRAGEPPVLASRGR